MRFALRSALLVAVAWVATGCTTRVGDLTVATPKNMRTSFEVLQRDVVGKDCFQTVLLLIPIGTQNPTIDGAIDDALDQVPEADALVDASLFQDDLFLLLYTQNCIRVEGDAVRTRPVPRGR